LQDEVAHMGLMTNLLSIFERFGANSDMATLKALMDNPSTGSSRVLGLVQQGITNADPSSLA
jgi:E3 ubiquitin-protein ligase listerin